METKDMNTIEVTVDKSHIVTIGERLYGESIELIRELINNAYDADAEEVRVSIKDDEIIIEDNGSGMDLDGLRQYFNIGSTVKRDSPKSPRFKRDRIGEFGIGKFASLSVCSRFEVWTKKGDFQAKVIFDKEQWRSSKDKWHIPLELQEPDPRLRDGTKVILKEVTKKFDITDVERRIIETVPIKAPDFTVYLNSHKINPKFIAGHKVPFLEGTEYGIVYGEIIITSQLEQDIADAGIAVKVKQVTIAKDFFGLEDSVKNIARIRGEVNADFLPITSDRTGFIKDTSQYKKFQEVMGQVINRIKPILDELTDYKENKRARRTLAEVLDRVKSALILNPDYCPEGLIPIAESASASGLGQPGYISPAKVKITSIEQELETAEMTQPKKKRKKRPMVKRLTPTAVVKKLKLGQQGISCCIEHFSPDGPECFTEGTVIYINRDHPLHQKASLKKDAYMFHMARLLTQEICLMKDPRSPKQAFQRQSKLLRDAFIDSQKGKSEVS